MAAEIRCIGEEAEAELDRADARECEELLDNLLEDEDYLEDLDD